MCVWVLLIHDRWVGRRGQQEGCERLWLCVCVGKDLSINARCTTCDGTNTQASYNSVTHKGDRQAQVPAHQFPVTPRTHAVSFLFDNPTHTTNWVSAATHTDTYVPVPRVPGSQAGSVAPPPRSPC